MIQAPDVGGGSNLKQSGMLGFCNFLGRPPFIFWQNVNLTKWSGTLFNDNCVDSTKIEIKLYLFQLILLTKWQINKMTWRPF